MKTHSFSVNGRTYAPPAAPIVVICLDGSSEEYLEAASARGFLPNLDRMARAGWRGRARAAMPTFTNVNNASIVTGQPPRVHGISGNYFFDRATGEEVMMNSSRFLRAETIFPAAQRAGRKVAVVTAKEKLRDIFGAGLIALGGIAFSSEKAGQARRDTHGLDDAEALAGPAPEIYSANASLYVLRAGVALLRSARADFLYLSTTDYIQHKHRPTDPEALDFYRAVDVELGRLLEQGAVVGFTADHGMNDKQRPDGSPNVIYLESELDAHFGPGFRVILPITDPYVAHHGALGSFAHVYLPPGVPLEAVRAWVGQRAGITEVYPAAEGAAILELPEDRVGDLLVSSDRSTVLGRTRAWHDLKAVQQGLRSHGGRAEEEVPFILSRPLGTAHRARAGAGLRNFDIFDFTCNGTD